MRALLSVLALLAPLSACMLPPAPAYAPMGVDTPLRARLLPFGAGSLGFSINRPAHVAVFEIDPRLGPRIVYPRFGGEGVALRPGTHTVWRSFSRSTGYGWGSAAAYPGSPGGSAGWAVQPRVFVLIASERPLRVAPYLGSPLALRAALGGVPYAASPQRLADELARLIVPAYANGDWVADVRVDWPAASAEPRRVPTHVVVCRDGRRLLVPWYVVSCPADRPATPPAAGEPPDSVPGEASPRRPERRRPERAQPPAPAPPAGTSRPERREPAATPRPSRPDRAGPARDPGGEAPRERPARPERAREPTPAPRPAETRPAPPRTEPAPEPR